MSTQYHQTKRPADFDTVFIRYGWRGLERYFGSRTTVNLRWLDEAGREQITALRRRYMRGDLSALDELNTPMQMAGE